MESTYQHLSLAYGPELQKLLNMPKYHGALNEHKLFEVDLPQSKSIEAHAQINEDTRSQREHEKSQVNQNSRKCAQETSSDADEAADSITQSTRKGGTISSETNGLRSQQCLLIQNSPTEVSFTY